jgi:hypothetical protein
MRIYKKWGIRVRTEGLRWAGAIAALALLMAGCAPAAPERASIVGGTLLAAMDEYPSPNVIDLSEPVARLPASYDENADASAWIVIVSCYAPNPQHTRDFGVIPATAVTDAIRAAAKRGAYDRYVGNCGR